MTSSATHIAHSPPLLLLLWLRSVGLSYMFGKLWDALFFKRQGAREVGDCCARTCGRESGPNAPPCPRTRGPRTPGPPCRRAGLRSRHGQRERLLQPSLVPAHPRRPHAMPQQPRGRGRRSRLRALLPTDAAPPQGGCRESAAHDDDAHAPRSQDLWNRPIASAPGAWIDVMERTGLR